MAFRELLRGKQQLSESACLAILKQEKRGILSVLGDDVDPCGTPLDPYSCEEDGKLVNES